MGTRAKAAGLAILLGLVAAPAAATWSIVAVDPETGEVGGASATCTPWARVIFGVVPGKGIIVTQAASNKAARRHGEALLRQGRSPAEIVAAITDAGADPTHTRQQHGIVALGFTADAAGYSGRDTARVTGDLQGKGVSVQGNILAGQAVLGAALDAFEAARRDAAAPLAERLLRALEAGAAQGGDRRCGKQTAITAYLVVARPDDDADAPALRLATPLQYRGGDNAVTVLREMYAQTVP